MVCDLSKPEQVPALVDAVIERCGSIDILVNNAGTSWGAPAEKMPLEAWDKVMRLNVDAVFQLSQLVANRCFIPRRSGNIIVVASAAALRINAHMKTAGYFASKAAALHLTRALAAEWGPYGIRVNAICPGFFPSKMSEGLLETIEASVVAQTPLGRLGGDTDLMGAAVYLASAASRYVTGQYICVDGGATDRMSNTESSGVLELDHARLGAWLTEHVDGFRAPFETTQFSGGQSNPTYLIETAGRSLRVAA